MNIRHLQAALAVREHGSVSRAALLVHLSQSAVTQGIARLEQDLGASLFTRTSTGMQVNDCGELFLNRVDRAQRYLDAIDRAMGHESGSPGAKVRALTHSQLKALIAVADSGSYSRAAQRLSLTQPTVHRAVKTLQALCAQPLFQRSPTGVDPSWLARQMARQAGLYFAELAQGEAAINEYQGTGSGSVAIGALPWSRSELVPRAVSELLKERPDSVVRIVDGPYDEQLHALLHGQIDVIVGALRHPAPSPDVVQESLLTAPLNIVVRSGHWLSGKRRVSAQRLQKLEWIAPREQTPARKAFADFFHREGLEPPEHVIECSSLVATRGLLLASDRAALLPARQVDLEVTAGLLAVCPLALQGTGRDIGLTLRQDWLPTGAQSRLIELLRALAR